MTDSDKEQPRLSAFDWFGVVAGTIGLVADTIALFAVFSVRSPTAARGNLSCGVWALILLAGFYSLVLVSFYSHRYVAARIRRQGVPEDHHFQGRVIQAARTFTLATSLPLTFAIGMLMMVDYVRRPAPDGIASEDVAARELRIAEIEFFSTPIIMVVAVVISVTCYIAGSLIYRALDPAWKEDVGI